MISCLVIFGLMVVLFAGCALAVPSPQIDKQPFGKTPDGQLVDIYTLRNSQGSEARIMTYGGTLVSLKMPDKSGKFTDVVLGYDRLEGYLDGGCYFGCLIGRYANRIANGKFSLAGKTFALARNNGPNSLHGGLKGFDKVIWSAQPGKNANGLTLELNYVSKDGEEGFPGNLNVTALYTLTEDNALQLDFTATTDQLTICNLTQHSYFNLSGQGDVLNHEVMIFADRFTPVNSNLVPTGELKPVTGTPLDFTTPKWVGARIRQDDAQLRFGAGYDQNFALNQQNREVNLAARVRDPASGRVMEVFSNQPGIQFYTGNHIGTTPGKNGLVYQNHWGLCLEPGVYPDAPNQPAFPSATLKPGETYQHTIRYKFSVE